MRRESSTVVVPTGPVGPELLAALARVPNISVVRGTAEAPAENSADPAPEPRPSWEAGAAAMREAARRQSTFVVVADDPLAGVASAWRAMWELAAGPAGASGFEAQAAQALTAWRGKQFELPDYYLVMAPPDGGTGADLYLGPLRAARPRRVAMAGIAGNEHETAGLVESLRSLEHGPWWPPLDELLTAARDFYAGGLTETQGLPARITPAGPRR
jgi:hypothetical protein